MEELLGAVLRICTDQKLMYLQNAKSIIAGLTKSSDHYDEAIKCLKEIKERYDRYDRPRQIHQTDFHEVPSLRGKEIRALHDMVTQHPPDYQVLLDLAATEKKRASRPVNSIADQPLWQLCSKRSTPVPSFDPYRTMKRLNCFDPRITAWTVYVLVILWRNVGPWTIANTAKNHTIHYSTRKRHSEATSLHVSVSSNILLMTCQVMVHKE